MYQFWHKNCQYSALNVQFYFNSVRRKQRKGASSALTTFSNTPLRSYIIGMELPKVVPWIDFSVYLIERLQKHQSQVYKIDKLIYFPIRPTDYSTVPW